MPPVLIDASKALADEQPQRRGPQRVVFLPAELRRACRRFIVEAYGVLSLERTVRLQAEILRPAAQEKQPRQRHEQPDGDSQGEKSAAPAVIRHEVLVDQRQH